MYECVMSSKDNQVCHNVEKEEIPFNSMMKEDFPEEMNLEMTFEEANWNVVMYPTKIFIVG